MHPTEGAGCCDFTEPSLAMYSAWLGLRPENPKLHLLGSEAILFCQTTNRLFYLNTTAAFLWCCLEEGLDLRETADALSEQFGVTPEDAGKDIAACLADWQAHRFLSQPALEEASGGHAGAADPPPSSTTAVAATEIPHPSADLPVQSRPNATDSRLIAAQPEPATIISTPCESQREYQIGARRLHVRFPSSTSHALVHPVLAHLEETAPPAAPGQPSATLEIGWNGRDYTLSRNRQELEQHIPTSGLAPSVVRHALLTAYERSGCLVAIHAAAVGSSGGCLLLPGAPGSGKSTLAAALMAEDVACLTDELVLLFKDQHVQPVPVSLGLKAGSWPLLRHHYPELTTLPVHHQADGTEVRYLPPSEKGSSRWNHTTVRAIVFPQWVPVAPYALTKIGTAQTLYRIAEAGYALPGTLDASVLTQLIDWLNPIDCFTLGVRDLDTATAQIKTLLT